LSHGQTRSLYIVLVYSEEYQTTDKGGHMCMNSALIACVVESFPEKSRLCSMVCNSVLRKGSLVGFTRQEEFSGVPIVYSFHIQYSYRQTNDVFLSSDAYPTGLHAQLHFIVACSLYCSNASENMQI